MGVHPLRAEHLQRLDEDGLAFVVVQGGELPGGPGDEDPVDAGGLQKAVERLQALLVEATIGVERDGNGGDQVAWGRDTTAPGIEGNQPWVSGCAAAHQDGQCESRVTASPLEPTRKSRSAPLSACMTWST